jgi:hypothetical protein
MRRHLVRAVVAGLVLTPLIAGVEGAQQQGQERDPRRDVQVGVPQGREGGGARGPGRRGGPPPGPTPRDANGRALLGGATPADKGVWQPGPVIANPLGAATEIPFQPWAKALFADRRTHQLEPHARCKPSGVARPFLTPYGVEIVDLPELERIYIFDIGGPHTYRTIYMDGRTHPEHLSPTYYGHSIGWWEGDTLVIDTIGFNEGFWLDRGGLPHTEKLHTLERLTRTDSLTIKYELTIDDPGAYTRPWTGGLNLRWEAGTELFEYVCQQANYADQLMVGPFESIDRRSHIVP